MIGRNLTILVLTAGLAVLGEHAALASPDTVSVGVVWTPPADPLLAAADLRAIRRSGFDAVRTVPMAVDRLYNLADTLGIGLYLDLEIRHVPGSNLADTSRAVLAAIRPLLDAAMRHESIRGIGVTAASGTRTDAACAAIAEWAGFVRRQMLRPLSVYYTTWYGPDDRCAEAADLVLIDSPDRSPSIATLVELAERTATPVGVASLGIPADGGDAQSRFFEETLPSFEGYATGPVFLYRWEAPAPWLHDPAPFGLDYGLHRTDGAPRRAAGVLTEMLVDGRPVFSHAAPTAEPERGSWIVFTGWLLILLLVLLSAFSARFRQTIPRYFFSHGFFRQSVREGREMLVGINTVLLIIFGIIIGLTGLQALRFAPEIGAMHVAWWWVHPSVRSLLDVLLARPVLLTVFLGSLATMLLSAWMLMWGVAVARTTVLGAGQALMLIVWPRWPLLALLPPTMLAATLPYETARVPALMIAAAVALIEVWSTVRTNLDMGSIARASPVVSVLLWLISPIVLFALVVGALWAVRPDPINFLLSVLFV